MMMNNLYQQHSQTSIDLENNNIMMQSMKSPHNTSFSNPFNTHQNKIARRNRKVKKGASSNVSEAITCRICLCEEKDTKEEDNPIVRVCQCKGSSGDIHVKCLQEWLNQKRKYSKMSSFQDNYIYKKSQCEVCGSMYPDMVEVKGKLHQIFEFKKPKNSNYIVIEVLGMPVGKNFSVVKIPDNYIIEVGRSNAELSIPDVSVSKKQATLKYDLSINELVLTDFNSKYGTHILVQRPIELQLNQPMFFMNGLSLIQIILKQRAQRCLCFPLLTGNKSKYVQLNKCMY